MRQAARIGMVALAAALLVAPATAQVTQATAPVAADPLWLPWLGCWQLVGDAVDRVAVENTGSRLVCVTPRADGDGVGITTFADGIAALEETVIADGERRSIERNGCSGWERARWSADGHRLFFDSEERCVESPGRNFSGVSLLAPGGVWVDVQAVSLGDRQHREILVQRYRRAGGEAEAEVGVVPLTQGQAIAAATARAAAAAPLDVDDIIEASEMVADEALQAVILERNAGFALDADELMRLADAGVSGPVVDLMVALSFPDEFIVDDGDIEAVDEPRDYRRRGPGGYWGGYWGSYYGPYPAYYVYDPFFAPFGYGYRFSGRTIRVVPRVGDTGSLFGGRVVKGSGYARVRSRQPESSGRFLRNLLGGSVRSSGTSGGSGTGSVGSSGGGAGGGAAVTPGGHTRGSGGSSRKAKPRGGGSGSASGSGSGSSSGSGS